MLQGTRGFGADEAGRGPVLGSLFVGFVDAPLDALPDGLADSKDLSREQIATLAETLVETDAVASTVIEITPAELDEKERNVTELTAEAMATAVNTTSESSQGVVDACHTVAGIFEGMVVDGLETPAEIDVTAQHEADANMEQVMAASILAKHEREKHVDRLSDTYGEIGSGYPSDPTTQAFLEEYIETHGELPPCARASWETSQNALDAAKQTAITEF